MMVSLMMSEFSPRPHQRHKRGAIAPSRRRHDRLFPRQRPRYHDRHMAREHWLRLSMTEGIGPILVARIVEAAGGNAAAACEAGVDLLRNVEGIGAAKAAKIHQSMRAAPVDTELARCDQLGVTLIC